MTTRSNNNSNSGNDNKKNSLPIKSILNLRLLVEFWQKEVLTNKTLKHMYASSVKKKLDEAPELLNPINDLKVLEKHRDLIDLLMTAIFPPARQESEIAAAFIPFTHQTIYSTTAYRRLFDYIQKSNKNNKKPEDDKKYLVVVLHAYRKILQRFYGIDVNFDFPWIVHFSDQVTGLDRYHKIDVDPQFVEIKSLKKIIPLTDEEKKELHDNLTDLDTWQKIIPMDNFEFQGFGLYKATDVTESELLSQLKYEMSKNDVLKSDEIFEILQQKIRSLFRLPDLQIGFSSIRGGKDLLQDCGVTTGRSLLLSLTNEYCPNNFKESIYGHMIKSLEPKIILDLSKHDNSTSIENVLLEHGILNIAIFPLVYEDQLIGLVEIAAKRPAVINGINTLKLESLMPMFVMAMRRHMEALSNRLQNIIREEATAIHPSVEWRFRNAAFNKIQKESNGEFAEMEPIVFDDVYSLYGLSDIRGSSTIRNQVIQQDLIAHLNLAKNVIQQSQKIKPMPILEELIYRITKYQSEIAEALNADEERRVLDFLHNEIEPLFDHLQEYDIKIQKKIKKYRDALDPELGFVFNKRKDFEESVARINESIAAFIDGEEDKAQEMYPHYFEKYKTDGVDYNIYIGASLVDKLDFNPIYIKNLRLWQLILMCRIVIKADSLKKELKMPLETAHLILVQSTPISIQFRFDEKRFDVNGSYNVKYEIVKKRIDKALIKNSDERLTQPGKIAIVYSHIKDATEYREYISYLQNQGYVENEIEDVELQDLQGVQGLHALRITVSTAKGKKIDAIIPESVEEAIRELSQNILE